MAVSMETALGQGANLPTKKRLNHNELERKREVLYELRDVIPTLHIVKPSTVLIMQKARDYIDLLRRTIQEMEVEINDLRRALVAAGYPLPMPSHQPVLCGFPNNPTAFAGSCQSPRLMQEQMLNVAQSNHLALDHHSQQLAFQALGDLSLARAHFDAQDIESISRLQLALSKGVSDLGSNTTRPISPVSPYQLDQVQGNTSGEFKGQPHLMISVAGVSSTPNRPAMGTHA
ncbi:hypothetical protein GGH93_002263 [Coemansia aciculifera]|nr:hypothetical protein GGH93_002263 [Coemansia aciculifera]